MMRFLPSSDLILSSATWSSALTWSSSQRLGAQFSDLVLSSATWSLTQTWSSSQRLGAQISDLVLSSATWSLTQTLVFISATWCSVQRLDHQLSDLVIRTVTPTSAPSLRLLPRLQRLLSRHQQVLLSQVHIQFYYTRGLPKGTPILSKHSHQDLHQAMTSNNNHSSYYNKTHNHRIQKFHTDRQMYGKLKYYRP